MKFFWFLILQMGLFASNDAVNLFAKPIKFNPLLCVQSVDDEALKKKQYDSGVLAQYYFNRDTDSTIKYRKRFIRYSLQLQNNDSLGKGYYLLAASLFQKGELEVSHKFADSALYYYQTAKDTLAVGISYQLLSSIFLSKTDYENSLLNLRLAERLYDTNPPEVYEQLRLYFNFGNVYLHLEHWDISETYYAKALDLSNTLDKSEQDYYEPLILLNLGLIYRERDEYQRTYDLYATLLKERSLDENTRIIILNKLASVCVLLGKNREAKELSEEALSAIEKNDSFSIYSAEIHSHYGLALIELKEYSKAEKILLKSLQLSKQIGDPSQIASRLSVLSDFYREIGKTERAFDYLQEMSELKDSIYTQESLQKLQSVEIDNAVLEKEDQIKKVKEEKLISETVLRKKYRGYILLVLTILFFSVLVFLVFLFRNKTIIAQNNQKIAEGKLQALRSQMNPHFVFNMINSVQDFILSSNKFEAYKYLSKFSDSIRLILENSEYSSLLIKDELNIIRLYVDLQQVRFPDKLEYEEHIFLSEEDLRIEIPAMVLQPLVENAIVHGVFNKSTAGKVIFTIKKDEKNECITCSIEDNGVGRIKAMEIKRSRKTLEARKSITNYNTKERMEILSKKFNKEFVYDIEDLYAGGTPTGTKVSIRFPYFN